MFRFQGNSAIFQRYRSPVTMRLSVSVLFFLTFASGNTACEQSKDRKPAKNPVSTSSPGPGEPGGPGGPNEDPGNTTSTTGATNPTSPTNPGAPTAADAGYMTPRQRPTKITGAVTRDVTANDVFITPVYVDSSAWNKTCVSLTWDGASGSARDLGCSHSNIQVNSKPASNMIVDQTLAIDFSSGSKRLNLHFDTYVQTDSSGRANNAGCDASGCPGPFTKVQGSSAKLTSSSPESIKCIKSGNVLVLFYDDKNDAAVRDDSSYRKTLLAGTGGKSAPGMPNLRNLHDPAILAAQYTDPGGSSAITEKQVRSKYGVDFDEVILQIDLGSAGHVLAGFESCQ